MQPLDVLIAMAAIRGSSSFRTAVTHFIAKGVRFFNLMFQGLLIDSRLSSNILEKIGVYDNVHLQPLHVISQDLR